MQHKFCYFLFQRTTTIWKTAESAQRNWYKTQLSCQKVENKDILRLWWAVDEFSICNLFKLSQISPDWCLIRNKFFFQQIFDKVFSTIIPNFWRNEQGFFWVKSRGAAWQKVNCLQTFLSDWGWFSKHFPSSKTTQYNNLYERKTKYNFAIAIICCT